MQYKKYIKILLFLCSLGCTAILDADVIQGKEIRHPQVPSRRLHRGSHIQNVNGNSSGFLGVQQALRQSCQNEILQIQEQIRQVKVESQLVEAELSVLESKKEHSMSFYEHDRLDYLQDRRSRIPFLLNTYQNRLAEMQQLLENLSH